jgi:hypothetical protein
MFSDVAWSKVNTTITPNTTIAPNGTLTADTMSIIDINSRIIQSPSLGAGTYTLSAYVKVLNTTTAGSVRFAPTIDGGNVNSIFTPTTEWERYTQTFTVNTTFSSIAVRGLSGGFVGDIAIWGLQLVQGTDAKPYFATTNRQDVPRLHYRNADGTVSTCPRLLLEPQRTNSIRNSTMVGAVAGSPGTLPTNYSSTNGGLTQTITGIGNENGLQYIDLRFNGTANTTAVTILFEGTTNIATLNTQTWTNSFYTKLVASPAPPLTYGCAVSERNSSGGYVADSRQEFTPTTTLRRFTYTISNLNASTAYLLPFYRMALTNGAAYDFTIRIAAPQMELGAYATTFIPTTTAAVTRLADYARQTGVSSLIGQTEGTVFVDAYFSVTAAGRFLSINDGTTFNRILLVRNSTNTVSLVVQSTTLQVLITSGILPNGTHRFAASYANNAFSLYIDGTLIGTATSGTVPACSVIDVGNENNANFFGDSIAQAALFPTRLTNAQLAQLTT